MNSPENNFLPPELAERTVLVTTSMYPRFNPDSRDPFDIDTVRGRLVLQTLELAKEQGLQIVLVEDGSSDEFRERLNHLGIIFLEGGRGMGAGRRMGFKAASELPGAEYILWNEPEKAPLIKYCLPQFIAPLVESEEIELVVAERDIVSFATYPAYQIESERKANKMINKLLRTHNLWPEHYPDMDFIFAPRFYKNTPRMIKYLTERFVNINTNRSVHTSNLIDFDRWPNSIVIPVIRELFDDRVSERKLVTVAKLPYRHPREQTESEINSPELSSKRWQQYVHLIYSVGRMAMYLEGNPNNGIRLEDDAA